MIIQICYKSKPRLCSVVTIISLDVFEINTLVTVLYHLNIAFTGSIPSTLHRQSTAAPTSTSSEQFSNLMKGLAVKRTFLQFSNRAIRALNGLQKYYGVCV
ncbi:hypothetical protein BgiBS90_019567, partial [Biomphalaria glabrata]